MLEPGKLRECMDYFKEDHRDAGESIEKELRAIDGRLADLEMKKQRVIDVDLSGDLSPRCCCVERRRNGNPSHLSSSG